MGDATTEVTVETTDETSGPFKSREQREKFLADAEAHGLLNGDAETDVAKWKALSRQNEKAAKDAQRELEKLRTASMSDQEKAVAEAKAAGRSEAAHEVRLERVRDKIEAKAAGKMADPDDAAALLGDISRFVADDGTIDTAAITAAIDQLVKAKPYLSPQPGAGSGEGGPRGTTRQTETLDSDPLLRDLKSKLGITT